MSPRPPSDRATEGPAEKQLKEWLEKQKTKIGSPEKQEWAAPPPRYVSGSSHSERDSLENLENKESRFRSDQAIDRNTELEDRSPSSEHPRE